MDEICLDISSSLYEPWPWKASIINDQHDDGNASKTTIKDMHHHRKLFCDFR